MADWIALATLFDRLSAAESIDALAEHTLTYLIERDPVLNAAVVIRSTNKSEANRLWVSSNNLTGIVASSADESRARLGQPTALASRLIDPAPLIVKRDQLNQHSWTSILPDSPLQDGIAIGVTLHGQPVGAIAIAAPGDVTSPDRFNLAEAAHLRLIAAQLAARLDLWSQIDPLPIGSAAQLAQVEKMAAIGALVAGVAHEIGNPLQSVLIGLQVTREVTTDGQPADLNLIAVMENEVRRLQRLTGQLLDLARPNRDMARPFSVNQQVEEVLVLTAKTMQHAKIHLENALAPIPDVYGSPDQIRQVILNVVINAIQAMPDGGQLRIATSRENGQIQLTVADSGHGIPPETLPHIFNPFFTTKADGSGLGLWLSQGIVNQHGGQFAIHSTPSAGTTVTVQLPIHTAGG